MSTSSISVELDDFHLDILGQLERINRLYTQITFCFPLNDNSSYYHEGLIDTLTVGIERLSANFPWVAGQVVHEGGTYEIKPFNNTCPFVVKDLRNGDSIPEWHTLQKAGFPFRMLDESTMAPCKTLAASNGSTAELPVFLIQANFINGGLLITFNGQHGSMDMTGLGQIIYLLAKACRDEPFTPLELSTGNMSRKNIIPLIEDYIPGPELDDHIIKDTSGVATHPPDPQFQAPKCTWAYFMFSATSLATLKSLAMISVCTDGFVSTDDVLSTFIWQSITRARLSRLSTPSTLKSVLSRNVDVRHHLSISPTYPGLITSSTSHVCAIDALVEESLGTIAAQLRSALDPAALRYKMRAKATLISQYGDTEKSSFATTFTPELDVRLSSWAKEKCYDLDFGLGPGIGKPEAVRRPQFMEGAREGLVYFLPKALDGEIAVGVCLRDEDLERLKMDTKFSEFGTYVG